MKEMKWTWGETIGPSEPIPTGDLTDKERLRSAFQYGSLELLAFGEVASLVDKPYTSSWTERDWKIHQERREELRKRLRQKRKMTRREYRAWLEEQHREWEL